MTTSWISRDRILPVITVVVLLGAVPAAVHRLIATRDPYLLTEQFFHDITARLSGIGRLRFLLQPTAAFALGFRDGRKDAVAKMPVFLHALLLHSSLALRHALKSVRNLVCMAILMDLLAQELLFHELRPGAALIVGPILIAIPYTIGRIMGHGRRKPVQT